MRRLAFVSRLLTTTAALVTLLVLLVAPRMTMGQLRRKTIAIVDGSTVQTRPGSASSTNYADRYAKHAGGRTMYNAGATSTPAPTVSKACKVGSVLRVEFSPAASGDGRIYGTVFGSGIHLIGKEDYFEYEIMWKDAQCNCSAEFETGTTYRLRDDGPLDALGYSPHSEKNGNMSAVAFGKWYKRSWRVASDLEGRYIDKFVLSAFVMPGTTATAFFKYIRVVRRHGEGRKVIFEEGQEPLSVNTYFPGTITTSCQHVTLVEASAVSFAREDSERQNVGRRNSSVYQVDDYSWSLVPGVSTILRGQITTRDLDDELAAAAQVNQGNAQRCSWLRPLEEFRQLWLGRSTHVSLLKVSIVLRHAAYSDVVLLPIWSLDTNHSSRRVHPPLPFFAVVTPPPWNAMSHLLNNSVLDVVVAYCLRQDSSGAGQGVATVASDPIEMKIFSKSVSLVLDDGKEQEENSGSMS